jgi:H-type lectin domain-containing protein
VQGQRATFYVSRNSHQTGAVNEQWTLDKEGDQTYTVEIFYPNEFEQKPTVIASILSITFSEARAAPSALSIEVDKGNVKKDSFELELTKTGDAVIKQVDVEWTAIDRH